MYILNQAVIEDERFSLKSYLLLAGLCFLAIPYLFPLSESIQQIIFLASIIVSGIPHGSLDYHVEKHTLQNSRIDLTLKGFLIGYLFKMAAYALSWFVLPSAALLVFIGLTAYHFGEIDWPAHKRSRTDAFLYSLYGLQLISFIIIKNIETAAPILELLVRDALAAELWIAWGTTVLPYLMGSIVLSFILLILGHQQLGWKGEMLVQFLVQSIFLFAIIYFLPLYLSFAFYFGVWHSFLSFNLVRKQLSLSNDSRGWFKLAKLALPFTALAWLGILVLVFIQLSSAWLLFSNLLIIIAVLTLPHNLVFTRIRVF